MRFLRSAIDAVRSILPDEIPISFASPEYLLLLLLLVPAVVLLGRRSLAGLDRIRRRMALGARLVVVVLLVLALAEVEWRDLTDRVEVVFVVDHSRSIPERRARLAKEVINKARERMDPRTDLGKVVVLGREAYNETTLRRDQPPITRYASDIDRNYTNLEVGIQRALEALEQNARGRIVLLSDGNQTSGDVQRAVALARKAQVPIDVIPLEYTYGKEVLVDAIQKLPNEAKIGEPFAFWVVVKASKRSEANVHLWRDGALIATKRVTLQPGNNRVDFQMELKEAGFFRVEAVVELLGKKQDKLFQNNTAHGFVFAKGEAQVLYIHDDADPDAAEGRHLISALRQSKIRVKVIPAVDFPLKLGVLQSYDAIILDDVARRRFSSAQQDNIEKAVADMGLGLVMIGGARSFGAGEWRGSPVERALPVEMDIKQEEVIPDGALVMIMHSSEFAQGNALAIQVCQKAVDGLSAKDTVGVLIYGPRGSQWAVKPVQARNKAAIKGAIARMQIGDMPDFDEIFRLALTSLKKLNSAVKHMIIMSDGDPSQPAPALLKECRKKKITVSTICYFAHGGAQGPNADLMKRIAAVTGGKYYYLKDPRSLPRIFLKESKRVTRSLIVNKNFVPAMRGNSPVLNGFNAFPSLSGYVLTEAKTRAGVTVALLTPEGAPLLAHGPYGLGKSLAFTSDAKARWGTNWVTWEGFRTFWSQSLRWVSKSVQEQVFTVTTRIKGDRGVIVLEAIDKERNVIDGLDITARVNPPDGKGEPQMVKLSQKGGGRYEGEFPVSKVGTYSVSLLSLNEKGTRVHSVTTGLVVPYSKEFRDLESNRPFLEELARSGGGRLLEAKQVTDWEVNLWDRSSLGQKEAMEKRWPLALALGLFLFLFDVTVRRVAIDWEKLFARAKGIVTRKPPDQPRTMDRLRERKAAVQQAREEVLTKFQATPTDREAGPVHVAGTAAPPPPASGGPRSQAPQPKQPTDGAEDVGYTNRLLAAKKRARKSIEDSSQEEGN